MTTTNQGAFGRDRDLSNGETYVARLTPIGRAAVSVVGVSGGTAWELLRSRWTDSNGVPASADDARWTLQKAERPFFGLFHFDALGGVADEVVLYWRTPDSFEIDCHGGDLATSRIVDFFESNGAIRISSSEWERCVERKAAGLPVFSAGSVDDLFFAASDELLVRTTTEETAKLACDQPGAWRDWFVSFQKAALQGRRSELTSMIDAILSDSLGRYLTEPFVVAFIGASNVGKSSLLNAILGFERAVASPVSGTTRDLVGVPFVFGGWNYRLVDAAGLRETDDPIENAGIALTAELARVADVVLRVYDPTRDRREQEDVIRRSCSENATTGWRRTLDVLNKNDLPPESWTSGWNDHISDEMIRVSAREGLGIEDMLDAIYRATVVVRRGDVDSSNRCRPLLWSTEQEDFLKRLRELCVAGRLNEVVGAVGL